MKSLRLALYQLSQTFEFGRIFWGTTDRWLNVARQQKKRRGDVVVVLKLTFRLLKTERSGRPRNAACLGRGIDNRMRRRQQPYRLEYSESLAPLFFFKAKLPTYHMRYAVWRMYSYAFCFFSPKSRGRTRSSKVIFPNYYSLPRTWYSIKKLAEDTLVPPLRGNGKKMFF